VIALLAALCSALAVLLGARCAQAAAQNDRGVELLKSQRDGWARMLRLAATEGRIDEAFGSRRVLVASLTGGGLAGFSLGGLPGAALGATLAPLAVRSTIRARRRRYAAQVDAGAAELAQALASLLAGGRSIRGALLAASATLPDPLKSELDRTTVDLTLGRSFAQALDALNARTGSKRIETLCGAIELQRGSGGDLVKMMRELATAFRERDRALRDARTASAQARYTAYVVAAIPVAVLAAIELASPSSVSGALTFLPTAVMLAIAIGLLASGTLLARRVGSVHE
jgi:tight adherence protein B